MQLARRASRSTRSPARQISHARERLQRSLICSRYSQTLRHSVHLQVLWYLFSYQSFDLVRLPLYVVALQAVSAALHLAPRLRETVEIDRLVLATTSAGFRTCSARSTRGPRTSVWQKARRFPCWLQTHRLKLGNQCAHQRRQQPRLTETERQNFSCSMTTRRKTKTPSTHSESAAQAAL